LVEPLKNGPSTESVGKSSLFGLGVYATSHDQVGSHAKPLFILEETSIIL